LIIDDQSFGLLGDVGCSSYGQIGIENVDAAHWRRASRLEQTVPEKGGLDGVMESMC